MAKPEETDPISNMEADVVRVLPVGPHWHNGKLEIMPYDPAWPAMYELERARIVQRVPAIIREIHHHGSTSVPGMHAKPIIDIMINVDRMPLEPEVRLAFTELGYVYTRELQEPKRLLIGRGEPWTYHLSICEQGSAFHKRTLIMRDYLRAHPDECARYTARKQEIAGQVTDIIRYAETKFSFVRDMSLRALQWDRAGRPT